MGVLAKDNSTITGHFSAAGTHQSQKSRTFRGPGITKDKAWPLYERLRSSYQACITAHNLLPDFKYVFRKAHSLFRVSLSSQAHHIGVLGLYGLGFRGRLPDLVELPWVLPPTH